MWEIIKSISEKLFNTPVSTEKNPAMTLSNTSRILSESLREFSEKSYDFYLSGDDKEGFEKVSIGVDTSYEFYRQVVDMLEQKRSSANEDNEAIEAENVVEQLLKVGCVASALCTDIAEKIDDWDFYAENFPKDKHTPELYFDGKITNMTLVEGDNLNDKIMIAHFNFKDRDYIISFRKFSEYFGEFAELELFLNNKPVAKFDLYGNFEVEFIGEHDVGIQEWRLGKVKSINVGLWMKDVIDISSQIKTNRENQHKEMVRSFNKSDITL